VASRYMMRTSSHRHRPCADPTGPGPEDPDRRADAPSGQ
jgi:hypothetical protein